MFASTVSTDRCDLYRVVRTDLNTWERTLLSYPPCSYQMAVKRARYYKQAFGQNGRYDYRVCFAQ